MADRGGIVALLFTDLVGSTSMYDRIGDERAEAVRRTHFAGLRKALTAHGGEEVKNLGDGLMVTFTSAVAAVEAAIDMQRTASQQVGEDGQRTEIRVGLHAGEPLQDESDYFGVSVNIAKRLCDRGAPGQILASSLIRALVSPRLRSGLRPMGELDLKGIEEPVDAYLVEWEPLSPQARLPPMLAVPPDAPFVGRERELDQLLAHWQRVVAGEGATPTVALLSGEPGIGKTRLVRELAARVVTGASLVLAGRSSDELVVPLEPFGEAFRHALTLWPEESSVVLTTPDIEPVLRPSGHQAGLPDTERPMLFAAVVDALVHAQAQAPVLLVLDDVHWADEATLLLLRHLVRAPLPRMLVVGTYRDTEIARGHPVASFLADLRREETVHRIALHGLEAPSVRRLLHGSDTSADRAVQQLADRITSETEGNPFFVGEIIRHLVEQGHLAVDGGGGGVQLATVPDRIDVPEGVREVVGRRLTRLSPTANELLAVASVIGRQFPARLLAEVAEAPLDEALDAVDEAMQARILEAGVGAPATFAFSHALIRETLLAEVSAVRRMRLHLRIGEALQRSGAPVAEVAHHLIEGGAIGDSRAMAEAAVAASEDARFRLAAFEDAASLASRALAVIGNEHPDLRCDLLTILGDSQIGAGDYAGLETLRTATELGRSLRDAARIARAVTYALRAGVPRPDTPPFVEASTLALDLLDHQPSVVRARLRAVLALSGETFAVDDRNAHTREVLEEARASGDDEAFLYATLARADVELAMGDMHAASATLDAGFARIGPGLTEAVLPFGTRYFELSLLLGDRSRAELELARIEQNRNFFNTHAWVDRLPQAGFALLDGRLAEAEALAAAEFQSRLGAMQAAGLLGVIALEQGRAASMIPLLEGEAARSGLAVWRAAVALFLLDAGRGDEAPPWTDGVLEQLDVEIGSALGLAIMAEVAYLLGDADLARGAATQLDAIRSVTLTSGVLCFGVRERYVALCAAATGDLDAAVPLLRAAAEANEAVPATLYAAHTMVDLAEVLLRRDAEGDADEARRLVDRATEIAQRLDLGRVARRAGAALAGAAPGDS